MNILYRSRAYCSHKFRIYTRRKFKTLTPLWSWKPWEKVFDGSIKITVEIVSHFQTRSFTLNCGPRCGPRRGSPWALIYDTQPRRSRTEYKEKRKKKKKESSKSRNHPRWEKGNILHWETVDRVASIGRQKLEIFWILGNFEYFSFFNFSIFLFLQFVPWNFSIPETSLSPPIQQLNSPIFYQFSSVSKLLAKIKKKDFSFTSSFSTFPYK